MTHDPRYIRRTRGRSMMFNRPLYGYTVRCSCGWEIKTNENKKRATSWFREHVRTAKAKEAKA